jgi:hypothetical protein
VLDDYLDHLRALPFVRDLKLGRPHADGSVPIEVSTATGNVRLEAVEASGAISYARRVGRPACARPATRSCSRCSSNPSW